MARFLLLLLAFLSPVFGAIATENARQDYVGTGALAAYAFTFPVQAATELRVFRQSDAAGTEAELVYNTDYTVALGSDGTGTVTLVAGSLTSGYKLSIQRGIPYNQTYNPATAAAYSAPALGRGLDRLAAEMARLKTDVARSIKVPYLEAGGDTVTKTGTLLDRAGYGLGFDASGNVTTVSSYGTVPTTTYSRTLVAASTADAARTILALPSQAMAARTVVANDTAGAANGAAVAIDDITVLSDGSTTRRDLSARASDLVNVRDFGALGDGITDDGPSINAALVYARTKGKPGSLNQVGGRIFLPKGRYLIKQTITVAEGDVILGEPSGLDSAPVGTASSGTNIVVSTTLSGGGGWANSVAITESGGGPLTIKDIGFNGTQTATVSTWLKSGDGATNIGVTQGHFKGVRVVGFTNGVTAYKFFDVDFNDVGFESNEVDFNILGTGAFDDFSAVRFANCTFFSPGTANFQISSAPTPKRVSFSSCEFYQGTNSAAKIGILLYDGAMTDWSFSSCAIVMQPLNYFFRSIDGTATCEGLSFSGCSSNGGALIGIPAIPAAASMRSIRLNGCRLEGSTVSLDTVSTGFVATGNVFRGASTLTVNAGQNSVIAGNDFALCTGTVFAPSGVHTGLVIASNNFPAAYTTFALNASSTRVKAYGNVGVADFDPASFVSGSVAYDPPSLADGAGATTTVTVTGAALGDYVTPSFSLDLQGISVTAYVSSANTVAVRFQNESGGVLDLASGTLRAIARKP